MPTSEKQRKAAFAEIARRRSGGRARLFAGMSMSDLESYAHEPLHKDKSSRSGTARDQARALRGKY